MPRLNGTGPNGMGAMTGRGMGGCSGVRVDGLGGTGLARGGSVGRGLGLGQGLGLGLGRGARRGCGRRLDARMAPGMTDVDAPDENEEKARLNLEATRLEAQLHRIRNRLDIMGKKE